MGNFKTQLNVRASLKAYVAAAVAGLGALQVALADGLAADDIVGVILAAVVAFQGVWWAPNSDV